MWICTLGSSVMCHCWWRDSGWVRAISIFSYELNHCHFGVVYRLCVSSLSLISKVGLGEQWRWDAGSLLQLTQDNFLTTINRSQLSVRGFGLRLHLYAVLISMCYYLACIRFCGLTSVIMDVLETAFSLQANIQKPDHCSPALCKWWVNLTCWVLVVVAQNRDISCSSKSPLQIQRGLSV